MASEKKYYTKDHDWIRLKDGKAYIGKTEFGLRNIGDMILIDLPSENEEVTEGDEIAYLEGAKGTISVCAPFGGIIAEINEDLLDKPEHLNKKCESTFIVAIFSEDGYDTSECLNNDEYEDYMFILSAE